MISPIFIVGSPRSGTTLLRFMLSSHPDLYIPDETGFIPHLIKPERVGDALTRAEVSALLDRIGQLNYLWRNLVTDVSAFYQSLPEPNLTNILDALFCRVVADHHASRWGDKTPLYVQHMPLIANIFPRVQFVHVIRDGRDATLSAQQKWGRSQFWYMDNYYLLKNWVANVAIGRRDGALLPKTQYYEVRYEQLVREPENSLGQICDFLGESYQPAMLSHTSLARQVGPGPDNHTEVMKPISTASVGRWRTEMSAFEQKMADRIAGSLLSELFYERSEVDPFTLEDKLRFSFLAAKYRLSDTLRQLLYRTGFLTLNRNMRQSSPE